MMGKIYVIIALITTASYSNGNGNAGSLQANGEDSSGNLEQSSASYGDAPRFGRLEDFRRYQLLNQVARENLKQALIMKQRMNQERQEGSASPSRAENQENSDAKISHISSTNNGVPNGRNNNKIKHIARAKGRNVKFINREQQSRHDQSPQVNLYADTKDDETADVHKDRSALKSLTKTKLYAKNKAREDKSNNSNRNSTAGKPTNYGNNKSNGTTSGGNLTDEGALRKDLVKETHKFFDFTSGSEIVGGERRNMPSNQPSFDVLQGPPGHAILYTSKMLPHDTRNLETCKSEVLNGDIPVRIVVKEPQPQLQRMHNTHKNSGKRKMHNQQKTKTMNHMKGRTQSDIAPSRAKDGNGKRNIMQYFTKVFHQPTNQRVGGTFLSVHPIKHKVLMDGDLVPERAMDDDSHPVPARRQFWKRDTLGDDWSQAAIQNAIQAAGYRRGDLLSMEKAIRDLNREDVKFVQRLIPPMESNKGNDEQDPEDTEFDLDATLNEADLTSDYGHRESTGERQRRMVLKRDGVEYFQNEDGKSQEPSLGDDDVRQKSVKFLPKRETPEDDFYEPAEDLGERYELTQENVNSYMPKEGGRIMSNGALMGYNVAMQGEENKEETDNEDDDYTNNLFDVRSIIEEEADLHGGGGTRSYLANIKNKNQQRMLQEKNERRKSGG